jgi:hypothetical protein
MSQWEQLVQESGVQNSLRFSEDVLEWLAQEIGSYQDLAENFPSRLLRYLVDGEDEQVLADLGAAIVQQSQQAIASRSIWQSHHYRVQNPNKKNASQELCKVARVEDAGFYSRLARIYSVVHNTPYAGQTHIQFGVSTWLDPFLREIGNSFDAYRHDCLPNTPFPIALLEAMLREVDVNPISLLTLVYSSDPGDWNVRHLVPVVAGMQGFREFTLTHSSELRGVLNHPEIAYRVQALQRMALIDIPAEPFLEQLIDRALSSAKSERVVAIDLVKSVAEKAVPLVKERIQTGKADERLYGVQLLQIVAGDSAREFLEALLPTEKSEKVREAIEKILNPTVIDTTVEMQDYQLPSVPEVVLNVPLDPTVRAELEALFSLAKPTESTTNPEKISEYHEKACQLMQNGNFKSCHAFIIFSNTWSHQRWQKQFFKFLEHPQLQLIQVLRLLTMMQVIRLDDGYGMTSYLSHYRKTHAASFGLRELAAYVKALEGNEELVTKTVFPQYSYLSGFSIFSQWGEDVIWHYFVDRLNVLETAIAPKKNHNDYYYNDHRKQALEIIGTFPYPPASLVPQLWELALSGTKAEHLMAQNAIQRLPKSKVAIIKFLSDRDAQKRIIAAKWLARLNETSVIPELKALLKKEKTETVRDAWMRSLEKLGASVDEFLNRDALLSESQAILKKGIPVAIAWFPFDRLPTLHWQDSGAVVDPQIITGFIVQTHKQKNVEPSPMLRRYLNDMRESDRATLGQFILETWIGQDTLPKYTQDEAAKLAESEAASIWQNHQQFIKNTPGTEEEIYQRTVEDFKQRYLAFGQNKPMTPEMDKVWEESAKRSAAYLIMQRQAFEAETEDGLYRQSLSRYLAELKSSATKDKGILAIAAATCNATAIPVISSYLKTHYGMRLAQCLALLQVLGWMENFSAIQLLLSVSSRFRTQKIQKEAGTIVNQIADRNGWTRDELGDRTVPWCGFSDRDQMILDYGDRSFTARLDSSFNLLLTDETGKVIKSLPSPRKDDNEELAMSAKKQLNDSKKQLKQVIALQKERLYEAMCTQRAWTCQDWEAFLHQHPIVSRYCQKLIWAVFEDSQLVTTFRPMEDGTLTDAEDNEVMIASTSDIKLAHGSLISANLCQAWRSHCADYDIAPVFEQFNEGQYKLPDSQQEAQELSDFEGHLIESFQLRGRATKLGYTRGQTEDAGYFYNYKKSFAGLGLQASIGFSGNYLPEENRVVALTQLCFSKLGGDRTQSYYQDLRIPLKEVPPVLLSEVYEDMRSLSAIGTGYDPAWETKYY